MLMLCSENILAKLTSYVDNNSVYSFGNMKAVAGKNYHVSVDPEGISFYRGMNCKGVLPEQHESGGRYENIKSHSAEADRYFILASLSKDSVRCCRSLYRYQDIYYWQNGPEFIITTDLHVIAAISEKHEICADFLSLFVNNHPSACFTSPLSTIKKLEGGCELTYSDSRFCIRPLQTLACRGGDYLETMMDLLKSVSLNRQIYLHYSGGMDSTLLLLLLKEAGINFTALHYDAYIFENDSEKLLAESVCKKYGIEFHVIKPTLFFKNQIARASHPMDVSAFHTDLSSETFRFSDISSAEALVLDGQGGDSLFVQNPSEKVGFDFLRRGKFFSAYSRLSDLSQLKNRNLADLILRNSRRLFGRNSDQITNSFGHPLTESVDEHLSQYDYNCDLISMMEKMPLAGSTEYSSFSPILSLNSVRNFMSYDYHKNYSDEDDRLKIRNMLYKRFQEPIVYDKRKRSSVNVLYQMLERQKDFIRAVIEDTSLPELAGFDLHLLRSSLEMNASVRIDENAVRLMRLADAYRYYHSLKLT